MGDHKGRLTTQERSILDGEPNVCVVGIENVGPVTWRVHPALNSAGGGVEIFSQIFPGITIVIPRQRKPMPGVKSAGRNMRPIVFVEHILCLQGGTLIELGLQMQWRQPVGYPLLIGLVEYVDGGDVGGEGEHPDTGRPEQVSRNLHADDQDGDDRQAMQANNMRAVIIVPMRHEPALEMAADRVLHKLFAHRAIVHEIFNQKTPQGAGSIWRGQQDLLLELAVL